MGDDFGSDSGNGQTFQELELRLNAPLGGYHNIKDGEKEPVSFHETTAWTYGSGLTTPNWYGTVMNGGYAFNTDGSGVQFKDGDAEGSVLFYFDMGAGVYADVSGGDYWTYNMAQFAIGSGKLYGTNGDPADLTTAGEAR